MFCLILQISGKAFSQDNRNAVIKGYKSMYEYIYFDSVNKLSNNQIRDLKKTYTAYITFKVDTTANIIDLEIIEIPGIDLPAIIKTYFEKLVRSTNGQWMPQMKDSKKVVSDEFIFQVDLVKKDQSIEDRVKDSEPITEYFFGSKKKVDKIERIAFSTNKRLIPLSY